MIHIIKASNVSIPVLVTIPSPKSGLSYGWRKLIADKIGIDQASVIKLSNVVQRNGGYGGFKAELGKMAKTGVKVDPQVTMDIHRYSQCQVR
jgi:hypothetical protein